MPDVFDASEAYVEQKRSETPLNPRRSRNPDEYSQVLAEAEPCTNNFAAYAPKPVGMSFETQDPDEKILLFLRQHPIVNVPWILVALFMLVAPILFLPFLPPFALLPGQFQFILILFWYLATFGFVLESSLMWLFNSFIVTDERMIDIDFISLIYKDVNYAQLDKIQDINVATGGVLFSLLDVGSVFVQTASEVPEFVFQNVSHPSRVVKLLNELTLEEEREKIEGRVR